MTPAPTAQFEHRREADQGTPSLRRHVVERSPCAAGAWPGRSQVCDGHGLRRGGRWVTFPAHGREAIQQSHRMRAQHGGSQPQVRLGSERKARGGRAALIAACRHHSV